MATIRSHALRLAAQQQEGVELSHGLESKHQSNGFSTITGSVPAIENENTGRTSEDLQFVESGS